MVVAQALTLATRNMSFFIPQKPLTTHSYTQTHSLALNPKPYPLPLRTLIITSSRKNYNNNANDDNTNMFHHDKTSSRKNYSNNNPNDDNKNVFHHDKPPSSRTPSKSRRGNAREKTLKPDPVYHNRLVNMLVNRILKNGKKSLAYQIIYRALKKIQQKTETNPLLLLRQAVRRVTPEVTVKARRRRGKSFQVPHEVGSVQGKALAIRWLLWAARKRSGRNMSFKLSYELMDAAKGSGDAFRKMEEIHNMAEASRAFAHIR